MRARRKREGGRDGCCGVWCSADRPRKNRVLRGGSWNNNGQNCRSSNRNRNTPGNRNNNNGFRCLSTAHERDASSASPEPGSSRRTRERGCAVQGGDPVSFGSGLFRGRSRAAKIASPPVRLVARANVGPGGDAVWAGCRAEQPCCAAGFRSTERTWTVVYLLEGAGSGASLAEGAVEKLAVGPVLTAIVAGWGSCDPAFAGRIRRIRRTVAGRPRRDPGCSTACDAWGFHAGSVGCFPGAGSRASLADAAGYSVGCNCIENETARRNLGFRRAVLGENRRGNACSRLPLLTRRATGGGVTPL